MSDYIKREDAIFIALQQPFYSLISEIKQLEGIDLVRCKECYMCDEEMWCSFYDSIMESDDYCNYGERESDE